jgi:hypothetical protein
MLFIFHPQALFFKMDTMENKNMVTNSATMATFTLIHTTLFVRIFPIFLKIEIKTTTRTSLETILTTTIFLNFVVYITYSDIKSAALPAILAITALAAVTFLSRLGIITATCLCTFIQYITRQLNKAQRQASMNRGQFLILST